MDVWLRDRRALMLIVAALFVAVTALRFLAHTHYGEGITLLYTLPIALLALRFGPIGGIAGAAAGVTLFVVWASAEDLGVGAIGYGTRATAFLMLGGLVGHLSQERVRLGATNTRWFEMSSDMLSEASLDGRFTRLNDRWERALGWTREELQARPYAELIHPDDRGTSLAAAGSLASAPSEVADLENRFRTREGAWRWLLWSMRSDEHRVYAVAKDVTDRKALEHEREELVTRLNAMARTDPLTGLANRRAWEEEVRLAIARARRQGHVLALVLLDLDRFKQFNDTHGHQAGDALLAQAGEAWRMTLRVTDFLARYGGEEFAVLLPDCPAQDALGVLERLRAATPQGQTCSAGIAFWNGSEEPEELVARADAALYAAKHEGRDRVVTAG